MTDINSGRKNNLPRSIRVGHDATARPRRSTNQRLAILAPSAGVMPVATPKTTPTAK
jgi:hypothetical protein